MIAVTIKERISELRSALNEAKNCLIMDNYRQSYGHDICLQIDKVIPHLDAIEKELECSLDVTPMASHEKDRLIYGSIETVEFLYKRLQELEGEREWGIRDPEGGIVWSYDSKEHAQLGAKHYPPRKLVSRRAAGPWEEE